jgi:AcrR family transcriptional regulator
LNRNSKRNHLIAAALSIVKTHGAEKLTLDAVAKEAGVSKGGLMHHFPNKEALINAMVEEATGHFESDINERVAHAGNGEGRWTRAYMEATFEDVKGMNSVCTALIASLFTNPDLLGKVREQYAVWQNNVENDGIDPVRSTVVRLAVDGLWFSDILGLGTLSEELREKVIGLLTEMTRGETVT